MRRDENAGLVHVRDDLALASGTSLSCVDVLGLRSQKGSSNFKVVEPFSNGAIVLKGKKEIQIHFSDVASGELGPQRFL